jgi:aminoglycoside phosphotransferase (APT) family kinase protein
MDLGKPIARGRTADVYNWQDGEVLKLFHDWFDLEDIQFEQFINSAIHAAGLPVPAVGEILQINGHNGLVYERVNGQSVWKMLMKQPWNLPMFARQTAVLHAGMHSAIIQADIPSQAKRLENKIRQAEALPAHFRETALKGLSGLPKGDSLCHGDFHPGNILVSGRKFVIIDWIDSSVGNSLADVARTSIIILGATASAQIPNIMERFIVRRFHAIYLQHYFELRPGGENEYRQWLPVIAAARLSENIPELEQWLLNQVENALK